MTRLSENLSSWDLSTYAELLPLPAPDVNKYSRGNIFIVAGSLRYPGAAVLTASAAARSGAGYVRLACPDIIRTVEQCQLISVPVEAHESADGTFAVSAASAVLAQALDYDASVIGPGLGHTDGTRAVVDAMLNGCTHPLLIDADALGIIARDMSGVEARKAAGLVTVLTPHEGEMRKLLAGIGIDHEALDMGDMDARIAAAGDVARAYGAVVVFKGPITYITDGDETVVSDHGTQALATAGTGDVLSGIIGALLAQKLSPLSAAALGVCLHGFAGRAAARKHSSFSVVAEDVVACLGDAVFDLLKEGDRDE